MLKKIIFENSAILNGQKFYLAKLLSFHPYASIFHPHLSISTIWQHSPILDAHLILKEEICKVLKKHNNNKTTFVRCLH